MRSVFVYGNTQYDMIIINYDRSIEKTVQTNHGHAYGRYRTC